MVYPVFLKLAGKRVVVVGGGPVAAAKLEGLLAAGALVTVVAPEISPEIEREGVTVRRRTFRRDDLDGAWWVVAAAPPEVNREVQDAAEARQLFVNAVDDPDHATAYLGSVVRRDGVTMAISTDGRAPALAGLLREALEPGCRRISMRGWRRRTRRAGSGKKPACRWISGGRGCWRR